jgi:hypothetical protein
MGRTFWWFANQTEDGEHPDFSGDDSRCARDDGVVHGFRRIVQSETTVRKHLGRTL